MFTRLRFPVLAFCMLALATLISPSTARAEHCNHKICIDPNGGGSCSADGGQYLTTHCISNGTVCLWEDCDET